MKTGNIDIKMESEKVEIVLYPDKYSVDANFEFFNYGETRTIDVGFPYYVYSERKTPEEYFGKVFFYTFRTWVNGQEYEVKDVPEVMVIDELVSNEDPNVFVGIRDPEEIDAIKKKFREHKLPDGYIVKERRWYVKRVTFEAHAKTVSRVYYEIPYIFYAQTGCSIEYIYGTGVSWKDSIGKAQFIVKNPLKNMELKKPCFSNDSFYTYLYNDNRKDAYGMYEGLVERIERTYKKNNRIKQTQLSIYFIELETTTAPYGTRNLIYHYKKVKTLVLDFKDSMKIQDFQLNVNTKPQKPYTNVLGILTIRDVYNGVDNDTCIAEIQFDK